MNIKDALPPFLIGIGFGLIVAAIVVRTCTDEKALSRILLHSSLVPIVSVRVFFTKRRGVI